MPELARITSPYVHFRVDSNTFIMGNPMPESILTLCQGRLYPPVRDLALSPTKDWPLHSWKHTDLRVILCSFLPLDGSAVWLRERLCEHAELELLQQPDVPPGSYAEAHRVDWHCSEQVKKKWKEVVRFWTERVCRFLRRNQHVVISPEFFWGKWIFCRFSSSSLCTQLFSYKRWLSV